MEHNFSSFLNFWEVCNRLGIFAVQDNPRHWFGYHNGLRVEFLPREGKFSFRIPPGGAAAMMPFMSKCSLLMTAAYCPA